MNRRGLYARWAVAFAGLGLGCFVDGLRAELGAALALAWFVLAFLIFYRTR